jgi:energy-coupling factor transporter ATP-binding protein EcfA2
MTKIIPNPYDEIAELKNGFFNFSFPKSVEYLQKNGRTLFGDHFTIFEKDHELIYKLLVYAIADFENASRFNLILKKGILLNGPVGCGKTSLMTLIKAFLPKEKQYTMKSVREITFEFEKDGFQVIGRYSKLAFCKPPFSLINRSFCFDDLGTEHPIKYYGNVCNVLAEILLSRYDLFIQKGILTHITTNLSASELESLYGSRVRSRLREMFNLVAFDRNSKDKRI